MSRMRVSETGLSTTGLGRLPNTLDHYNTVTSQIRTSGVTLTTRTLLRSRALSSTKGI